MRFLLFILFVGISLGWEIDLEISKPYKLEGTSETIGPGVYLSEKNFKELAKEELEYKKIISSQKSEIDFLNKKVFLMEFEKESLKRIQAEVEKVRLERDFLQKEREELNKEKEQLYLKAMGLLERENKNLRMENKILKWAFPLSAIAGFMVK